MCDNILALTGFGDVMVFTVFSFEKISLVERRRLTNVINAGILSLHLLSPFFLILASSCNRID